MMIPAPAPMVPLSIMVDSPDDVPAADRTDRHGYTRPIDRGQLREPLPGLRAQSLASPGSGALHAVVYYTEINAGSAGPDTHIHEFDQYYLVLDGELTVELALEKHVVPSRAGGRACRRSASPVQHRSGNREAPVRVDAGSRGGQTMGPWRRLHRER